jgi:sugar phosphate permease
MSDTTIRAAAPALPSESATYDRILWRLMPFLMLVYVVSFIDRANIGFAKLGFTGDLGFSEAVYGTGAGIFYVGYILLEIPSNLYLARVGVRRTLMRIMILWGLCCMGLGFMQSEWSYYTLRLLLGAAEAGLFPGILLYLTYWVPSARRARFTALFMASIPIAGIAGGPLAGAIMGGLDGAGGLAGWQWLFLVEGLPAVILGFVAYAYLDDSPAQAKWLDTSEKAQVARELEADQVRQRTKGQSHGSFRAAMADPKFYSLAGLAFALLVGTAGLFIWVPTIIRRTGVESVWEIGLLSAIPFAIGLVIQFLVARHSDKTQERRWHSAAPALVAAAGWFLLPFVADHTALAILVLVVVTAGTLATMGPFWTLPAAVLSPAAAAGGIALITTIAGAGNAFSPTLVGWLADVTGSFAAGQIYFGALFVLGAGLMLAGTKPQRA